MNPLEFKKIWNLSYTELALVLGYESDRTVRRWELAHANPQQSAYVVCYLLNSKWIAQGKKIVVGLNFSLHPMELKKRWNLSYMELAIVLGYESDRTVRSWALTGEMYREPQPPVCVACYLLNEKWEKQGRNIVPYLCQQDIA